MTFTEIVDRISKRLNKTSAESLARIGESVNDVYKKVTSSINLNTSRRTEVSATASIGSQYITFTGIEKVISVIDKSTGRSRFLDEVSVDELDRMAVMDGDTPTHYAIFRCNAQSVQIKTNANAQTAYTIYAPGFIIAPTLSGSQEPAFPESYHDVLVSGVLYEEYMKLEKDRLAILEQRKYDDRMGDLRLYIATSPQQDIYQGKLAATSGSGGGVSGGSGGTTSTGTLSYTQTGLINFDRGTGAPFTVVSGAAVVTNLDADLLDGQHGSYYTNASNLASGTVPLARISGLTDSQVDASAAIAWSKISKTGSSLADLTTRSAAALSSGILPAARLGHAGICEGRLTLTSGSPVTSTDVTAATTLYFALYRGNRIALHDGASTWTVYEFSQMSIAVPATTSQMYDVFVYDNAGTPTMELLAWTNDTTRATSLTRMNGVHVKSGDSTRRYVGSFRTTGVSGQTEDSLTKRYVWNYQNRVRRPMYRMEGTASWTYTTATWRQMNNSALNQLDVVVGLAEVEIEITVGVSSSNSTGSVDASVGIGEDSTSAVATGALVGLSSVGNTAKTFASATLRKMPAVGRHYYAALEYSVATGTTTWYGTGTAYQAGITGSIEG